MRFAGVGAHDDVEAVQHVIARYECRGPSGDYAITQDLGRNGVWRITWLFPGRPEVRFEFEGKRGWQVTEDSREEINAETAAMVRGHAFVWLMLDPDCFFDGLVATGDGWSSAEGHTVEVVDGVPHRMTLQQGTPPDPVVIELAEWRPVGDLHLPHLCTAIDRAGRWEMRLAELTLS